MTVEEDGGLLFMALDTGDSIVDALAELASARSLTRGWVRGVGRVRRAELVGPGKLAGPLELVSLEGTLGPDGALRVALAGADGHMVGGRLVDAEAERVELRIEPRAEPARWVAPTDARAEPPPEAEPETPSWGDVAAASAQSSLDNNAAVTWAQVAAASEEPAPEPRPSSRPAPARSARRPSAAPPELIPQKGDFIQHRQFGRCKVEGPSKGGGVVVRLPSGIRKTIRLDYMDVGHPRDEGGRRVFPVRPKKR